MFSTGEDYTEDALAAVFRDAETVKEISAYQNHSKNAIGYYMIKYRDYEMNYC